MYSASDVKDLRERTGAGMMDCKKALDASNGDMDKAIDWLRENGIAKAAKKEGRIAAEGTTKIVVDGNKAVILEVNSETDFVAKNEKFVTFVDKIADILMNSDAKTMEETEGLGISELVAENTASIGEKLSFRRFEKFEKTDSQVFGAYSHMGGRISTLVVLEGGNEEVAKEVAMHAAAMNPAYLRPELVPTDVLDREKEIMKQELINEGKPADKVEFILKGKVDKYYSEVCLENQVFIKAENKETVKQYVEANNASIVSVVRYEVGEGIEKRNENFADEVMKQING